MLVAGAACSGDDGGSGTGATSTAGTATVGTTDGSSSSSSSGGVSESDGTASGSSSGGTDTSTGTSGSTGGSTSGSTSGSTTDTSTGGPVCPAECADMGGVCLGDLCCPEDQVCGDVCCAGGDVCSFNSCVTPGAECVDASECAADEYCEYSLGEPQMMGGEMCQGQQIKTGKCLPSPPECPPGQEPKEGEPITCLAKCEVIPDGSFNPVVKYHWNTGTVMMAPIVIQLDDDNCDGKVDERDIPEIVFNTFTAGNYNGDGTTRAISIVNGAIVEKWAVKSAVDPVNPGREVAGGNIDGKPGNEIVTCTTSGKVRALDATGAELWITKDVLGCVQPTITDLDGDGNAEVLVTGGVLDGATGALEAPLKAGNEAHAADINVDGELDTVEASKAKYWS
ncbi:MAG TPA: hypothetical protein PKW35_05885, partial [Nannocystaceae bacterium]|nr:hypothetical protein [Nannocystaceae bacterium]